MENTEKRMDIALLGESVLKQTARPVPVSSISDYRALAQRMESTLKSFGNRLGLAAPQVFESWQILVYQIPAALHPRYHAVIDAPVPMTAMINPVWEPLSEEMENGWEACISLPGLMGIVPRHAHIQVRYYDLDGNLCTRTASHFHARVLQHECDHLAGIVFPMRMESLTSLGFETQVLKYLD